MRFIRRCTFSPYGREGPLDSARAAVPIPRSGDQFPPCTYISNNINAHLIFIYIQTSNFEEKNKTDFK